MPEHDPDLIWIQDAEQEYERSRKWLDAQPELTHVTFAGDKRVYLKRSQLDKLLRTPRETQGGQRDSQAG